MAFVRVNKCNNKKLKCGPSLRRGSRIPWETGMRDDMAYGIIGYSLYTSFYKVDSLHPKFTFYPPAPLKGG